MTPLGPISYVHISSEYFLLCFSYLLSLTFLLSLLFLLSLIFLLSFISLVPPHSSGVLSVLKTVDTLLARDLGTQCSQLIALPNHLPSFPNRVLAGTILPIICRLCVANPQVWVYLDQCTRSIHTVNTADYTLDQHTRSPHLINTHCQRT